MGFKDQLQVIKSDHPDIQVEWVDSIESTQQTVPANTLLIADHQSAGVGRRGHKWLTPKGRSICFSYRTRLNTPAGNMSGYALIVAVGIIQVMNQFDQHSAQIKWPNDLYSDGQKFAGILIHLKPNSDRSIDVVTGVGINWSLTHDQLNSVNQAVTNIPLPDKPTRSHFINLLIKQFNTNNNLFINEGLRPFLTIFKQHDFLANKAITLTQDQNQFHGKYIGVDEQGQIMVELDHTINRFSAGEVSVRTI